MAEKTTIARPYAQAAFEIAKIEGDLRAWSEMLQLLAVVVSDTAMQNLLGNPEISREKLVDLIQSICGDKLTAKGKNFVNVLAENGRLNVLTEIAEQYELQRAESEKTVEAEVTSAFPLSDAQKKQLVEGLKKRLGRDVTLVAKTDDSIIGGAIVRAGDLVIDGSVTSQLNKLSNTLMR